MVVKNVILAIKTSLENMDKNYCKSSYKDYFQIELNSLKKCLAERKYLERPFVYEFYHQLRKLLQNGEVDLGGPITQAGIDKVHKHYSGNEKIPDFIICVPNISPNLAAIEFRHTSNPTRIESDLKKLAELRREFGYSYVIEVIFGDEASLKNLKKYLYELSDPQGEKIMFVDFCVDLGKVSAGMIGYTG